jgi:hypothetical protein
VPYYINHFLHVSFIKVVGVSLTGFLNKVWTFGVEIVLSLVCV